MVTCTVGRHTPMTGFLSTEWGCGEKTTVGSLIGLFCHIRLLLLSAYSELGALTMFIDYQFKISNKIMNQTICGRVVVSTGVLRPPRALEKVAHSPLQSLTSTTGGSREKNKIPSGTGSSSSRSQRRLPTRHSTNSIFLLNSTFVKMYFFLD